MEFWEELAKRKFRLPYDARRRTFLPVDFGLVRTVATDAAAASLYDRAYLRLQWIDEVVAHAGEYLQGSFVRPSPQHIRAFLAYAFDDKDLRNRPGVQWAHLGEVVRDILDEEAFPLLRTASEPRRVCGDTTRTLVYYRDRAQLRLLYTTLMMTETLMKDKLWRKTAKERGL